jgi:hypothetical protein
MTKGRAKLPWRAVAGQRPFSSPWVGRRLISAPVGMTHSFARKMPKNAGKIDVEGKRRTFLI